MRVAWIRKCFVGSGGRDLKSFDSWRNVEAMREFMNIAKALSDANRVRMLLALRGRELCACQLTELMGLAPSTMSKHLSILYQAQLVDTRKDGRWVYFSRPGKILPAPIRQALDWVDSSLANSEQAVADAKSLSEVLEIDPSDLCRKQCRP